MLVNPISEKTIRQCQHRLNIQMIANDLAPVTIVGESAATDTSVKPEVKVDEDEDKKVKVE